jgi:hypothetical protein
LLLRLKSGYKVPRRNFAYAPGKLVHPLYGRLQFAYLYRSAVKKPKIID